MATGTQAGLRYKVFDADGKRIAACFYASDAAVLVAAHGDGAKIKIKSSIVFIEGDDEVSAAESYDAVGDLVLRREYEQELDLKSA